MPEPVRPESIVVVSRLAVDENRRTIGIRRNENVVRDYAVRDPIQRRRYTAERKFRLRQTSVARVHHVAVERVSVRNIVLCVVQRNSGAMVQEDFVVVYLIVVTPVIRLNAIAVVRVPVLLM